MKLDEASREDWKNLYEAAVEFKNTGCWDWMWDSDMFGVQNPDNGQIDYCCIMGRNKEHFALAVYLGKEGLDAYLKIQTGEIAPSDPDALHIQKCLMASFEDRKFVQKRDMDLINKLGLKFRGGNAWPLFRNHEPGYYPWYLTKQEARYLALCLKQAVDVALRFKKDKKLLPKPVITGKCFVRIPETNNNTIIWKDKIMDLPRESEKKADYNCQFDSERAKEIGKNKMRSGIWEIDWFYLPSPVRDKDERPYFPKTILIADNFSGLVIDFHMLKYSENLETAIDEFLTVLEGVDKMPYEIFVKKEDMFNILKGPARILGMNIKQADHLPSLEEARNAMLNFQGFE